MTSQRESDQHAKQRYSDSATLLIEIETGQILCVTHGVLAYGLPAKRKARRKHVPQRSG
jgi:hypothetical protein